MICAVAPVGVGVGAGAAAGSGAPCAAPAGAPNLAYRSRRLMRGCASTIRHSLLKRACSSLTARPAMAPERWRLLPATICFDTQTRAL